MKKAHNFIPIIALLGFFILVFSGFMKNKKSTTPWGAIPATTTEDNSITRICVDNGSSKDANFIGKGTGGQLSIKFTGANWSGVGNTCGNYERADKTINGKVFTFPDPNLYQYQMVLFEQGPGVRNYFTGICEEDKAYSVSTKKGFEYYVYTNDTSGDHEDNRGYDLFLLLFRIG